VGGVEGGGGGGGGGGRRTGGGEKGGRRREGCPGHHDTSSQLNLLNLLKEFTGTSKQAALFTFTFACLLSKYYFPRLISLPRHPIWNR